MINISSHQTDTDYGPRGWVKSLGHGGGHSFETLWAYEKVTLCGVNKALRKRFVKRTQADISAISNWTQPLVPQALF